MNSKSWYKILYIFSIIIFILSLIFFIYSVANKKYSSKLILENEKIKNDINLIENKSKVIEEDIDSLEIEFNLKSQEFYEKYGYQFDSNKSDEIRRLIEEYQDKNKILISEIKESLKAYGAYFESNIYEKEGYEKSINDFLELANEDNLEKHRDIYDELEIENYIEKSSGFSKNILVKNKDSKELKVLLFYASIYSSNINSFLNGEKSSLSDVYADLNNLLNIYTEMEKKGYNTGNLSAENLIYLKNNLEEKISSYYKNLGILKTLENGDKNEEIN